MATDDTEVASFGKNELFLQPDEIPAITTYLV